MTDLNPDATRLRQPVRDVNKDEIGNLARREGWPKAEVSLRPESNDARMALVRGQSCHDQFAREL